MRKRMISAIPMNTPEGGMTWLPLDQIAAVEVTSEDSAHPIEGALLDGNERGWRASLPGEQTIRLVFDAPQGIKRIRLVFIEDEVERSQEFVLHWSPDSGQTFHEIVRQQWNFNPHNSAQEIEEYQVDLHDVTQLELKITPDRSGGDSRASLAQLRLA